jgi:hypothetical protein
MDASKLVGLWFHLHEEDEGGRKVYRDRSYDFPLTRAPRPSLTLGEDGTATFGRPGPARGPGFSHRQAGSPCFVDILR